MYCLNMLDIALELARESPSYQDVANKFFEHFLLIAHATNHIAGEDVRLWDEEDGFYYDVMRPPVGRELPGARPLDGRADAALRRGDARARVAGALPGLLAASAVVPRRTGRSCVEHCPMMDVPGQGQRRLLALVDRERLVRVLSRMLSETEFLSPYGVRSLSRAHAQSTRTSSTIDGAAYRVDYEPAESRTGLFGGNSNWRGPVWMPVNYLVIESLQRLHHYYGELAQGGVPDRLGQA